MTTSWPRSPLWHLRYSEDNVKILNTLAKWCLCRWRSVIIHWRLNDCHNPQFGCTVLLISFTEVVGCILPSKLCQFSKLHLLRPKPLHALLNCFGDCAHHPARFLIVAQLGLLCPFVTLIIPIFPIVRTCMITQTVSDSNHHLLKSLFGHYDCQFRNFSMLYFILLLLNSCLCVCNSLSCPSGLSFNIIRNPFLFLFIAEKVCFSSFLGRIPLFGSQAVQCPKGSDSFCLQAALAFIWLMT